MNDTVRRNERPADRKEWARKHYADSERELDADTFVEGLSEDVRIVFGQTEMVSRAAVGESVEQLRLGGLVSMRHDITGLWEPEPGVVIAEATVTYVLKTGALSPLPVVTVFRWQDDEVAQVRIYLDGSPLTSALGVDQPNRV